MARSSQDTTTTDDITSTFAAPVSPPPAAHCTHRGPLQAADSFRQPRTAFKTRWHVVGRSHRTAPHRRFASTLVTYITTDLPLPLLLLHNTNFFFDLVIAHVLHHQLPPPASRTTTPPSISSPAATLSQHGAFKRTSSGELASLFHQKHAFAAFLTRHAAYSPLTSSDCPLRHLTTSASTITTLPNRQQQPTPSTTYQLSQAAFASSIPSGQLSLRTQQLSKHTRRYCLAAASSLAPSTPANVQRCSETTLLQPTRDALSLHSITKFRQQAYKSASTTARKPGSCYTVGIGG